MRILLLILTTVSTRINLWLLERQAGLSVPLCSLVQVPSGLARETYGGSVWESNPPFDPRRTESPALKAGKVTGLFSPPRAEYHEGKELIGRRNSSAFPQSAPVLQGCYARFGRQPRASSRSRDGHTASHGEPLVPEQLCYISERHPSLPQPARITVPCVVPSEILDSRGAHGRHKPMRVEIQNL